MQKESCGLLIKQIHDTIRRQADNSLRAKGLTLTQLRVLMELGEDGSDAKPLKELERRFNVAQSTIVGIVHRLEAKGFVHATVAPDDNRVKLVKLTPDGEMFRKTTISEVEQSETHMLSGLTDVEQQYFIRMLRIVYDTIQ
ncbi:MAG: MarR family transcriptional regulator [Oscillospiraceae bacterium]|nr:MarR family transcriptional regulator [Oscillospiraceae bacterium]